MTILYTAEHEWINATEPAAAVVGITMHAQDALGDVVFVELPEVGSRFAKGDVAGVVESVKAAADLYMSVGGEIVSCTVTTTDRITFNPADWNADGIVTVEDLRGRGDDEIPF
jgi:glycine cleavage system H protein